MRVRTNLNTLFLSAIIMFATSGAGCDDGKDPVDDAGPVNDADQDNDTELQVCPTCTYQSIQAAVNAAADGDTIRVAPGTYSMDPDTVEPCKAVVHVLGKHNIELIAEEGTVIDATGCVYGILVGDGEEREAPPAPVGLSCDANRPLVTGSRVEGFTITNAWRGVGFLNMQDYVIEDVTVMDGALMGVNSACSRNGRMANIVIQGAIRKGILSFGDDNVVLEDNTVTNSALAMSIDASTNVVIRRNHISENLVGIILASEEDTVQDPLLEGGVSIGYLDIEENEIENNNLPNTFNPVSDFLAIVPEGIGIIVPAGLEVNIRQNTISGHRSFGLCMLGMPLYVAGYPDSKLRPFVEESTVIENQFNNNGFNTDQGRFFPTEGADIFYVNDLFDLPTGVLYRDSGLFPPGALPEVPMTNCFRDNELNSSNQDYPAGVVASLPCD